MRISADFAKHGFVFVPGLFDRKKMRSLKRDLHDVFRYRMEILGDQIDTYDDRFIPNKVLFSFFRRWPNAYIECMKAIQNIHSLFSLSGEIGVSDVLEELGIQAPAFSTKPIVMINSRHTAQNESHWKTPPHQDWRSIQGSLNSTVFWIAIDDVPPECGPLEMIPGSHLWGLLATETDEWYRRITDNRVTDERFISVPAQAGDAIVFSGFLVHKSGEIDTGEIRCSLQYRFNDLAERSFIGRGYPSTYGSDRPVDDFVNSSCFPDGDDVAKALAESMERKNQ